MAAQSGPAVVVVGAGISGLAAAHELLRRRPDLRVTVLDGADRVGGKLAPVEVGGLRLDAGAEALLARRPEATDLARTVGLDAELVTPVTTAAGVWSRGRIVPLPSGTMMGIPAHSADAGALLGADEAALIDAEPGQPTDPVEDDIDVATYVASRVGPAVVERLVEPLLGGVYAGHADRLSLRATIPAAWATAHAGRSLVVAVRDQTASRPAPATPVFAGIRGGVAQLPLAARAAVERLGGTVRTNAMVRRLTRVVAGTDGAAAGSELGTGPTWRLTVGSRADEELVEADAVVLAVPAHPASRLLAEVSPGAAARLGGIEAASMALVTAVLPGAAGLASGSGVLVPPVEGRMVKAVTYSSAKWAWVADAAGDDLVVRLSVGRQGEEALLQRDDADLTAAALVELGEMLGAELPKPLGTAVVRWGGGLPQYAVGHVGLIEQVRNEVADVSGLALCGAYLDGLGVPACIASAHQAVTGLLRDLPEPAPREGRTMDA
jgi:protoporphyrinogen/coproporphyrinogen III oxidase